MPTDNLIRSLKYNTVTCDLSAIAFTPKSTHRTSVTHPRDIFHYFLTQKKKNLPISPFRLTKQAIQGDKLL